MAGVVPPKTKKKFFSQFSRSLGMKKRLTTSGGFWGARLTIRKYNYYK